MLTKNLGLFEYDVVNDSKQVFNIDKCLNMNWDILDEQFTILKGIDEEIKNSINDSIEDVKNLINTITTYHVDWTNGQDVPGSGIDFYCPADGLFTGTFTAANYDDYWLYINNIPIVRNYGELKQRVTSPFVIPVNKFDHITCIVLVTPKFFPYL